SIRIIHATGPRPTSGQLQSRPKPGVIGQGRVGREIFSRRTLCENSGAFLRAELARSVADKVDASIHAISVHDNSNDIAVLNFSNGPHRESIRADVPNASSGRNA